MSHSCSNLVSTSFLYNPYIPFLIAEILFASNYSTCIIMHIQPTTVMQFSHCLEIPMAQVVDALVP